MWCTVIYHLFCLSTYYSFIVSINNTFNNWMVEWCLSPSSAPVPVVSGVFFGVVECYWCIIYVMMVAWLLAIIINQNWHHHIHWIIATIILFFFHTTFFFETWVETQVFEWKETSYLRKFLVWFWGLSLRGHVTSVRKKIYL